MKKKKCGQHFICLLKSNEKWAAIFFYFFSLNFNSGIGIYILAVGLKWSQFTVKVDLTVLGPL